VPQIGDDAIAVGFIYQTDVVTPVGTAAILDSSVDPEFIDTKNRPALAQCFEHKKTGERLTVVVNHLKSKGSDCDELEDPDMGDGQGNCNQTRTKAATALANWLQTDPCGCEDPDALIVGDLNAYAREDPIMALRDAGYTDLISAFVGIDAYSYVFFGQAGYLDHALATPSLVEKVVGTTVWHINADEPRSLDYNDDILDPGESTSTLNPAYLYRSDAYRSSDHDPVLVHLKATLQFYLPLVVRSWTAQR
jgi:predicted extracellular nuclease